LWRKLYSCPPCWPFPTGKELQVNQAVAVLALLTLLVMASIVLMIVSRG
jgi:hypothetical protein